MVKNFICFKQSLIKNKFRYSQTPCATLMKMLHSVAANINHPPSFLQLRNYYALCVIECTSVESIINLPPCLMRNSVFFDKIVFLIMGPNFSLALKQNFNDIYSQNKEFYGQHCEYKLVSTD